MKFKNNTDIAVITIRGVDFPKGEAVVVDDAELAAKIDAMPEFIRARTRAPKVEVEEVAEDQK